MKNSLKSGMKSWMVQTNCSYTRYKDRKSHFWNTWVQFNRLEVEVNLDIGNCDKIFIRH